MHEYILDALEVVSSIVSSSDLPDEQFIQAVNDQARLMAGINPDELWDDTH